MDDKLTLLEAVKGGCMDKVYELLKLQQSSEEINSSLCWAARLGHGVIVRVLLEHGGDVHFQDFIGVTPLIWAVIFSPTINVVEILLKNGSNINHSSKKFRQTALHAAVIRGRVDLVSLLIENGADLNAQDYLHKTPLLHAVCRGHMDCAVVLIKNNCDVDLAGVVGQQLMTPLICALIKNDLNMLKVLVLAGAKFQRSAIYQTLSFQEYYTTIETNLNLQMRPEFLQQRCRVYLREYLRPDFINKLHKLSGILPLPLKNFLLLSELDNCIV